MPNPLKDLITRQIQLSGPMGLDSFMQLCLHHDPHGYYFRGEGIGWAGDFITAPEISPLFGQSVSAWVNEAWENLGQPQRWRLVELGPGRGALMKEILSHLSSSPALLQMVEASPSFQRQISERVEQPIEFVGDLGALPESNLPTILIGNEYLDALPLRQYRRVKGEIQEICVGLSDQQDLCFATRSPTSIPCPLAVDQDGYWEVSLAAQTHLKFLCQEVAQNGGAALLIDYGYLTPTGEPTFQALAAHEKVNPLLDPGAADLTALVDFGTLQAICDQQDLSTIIETHRDFLVRHGFENLLEAQPDQAAPAARLVRDDGMGALFKALSFQAPSP